MASSVLVPRFTIEDLAQFPDDGNRYELVDGFLLVTPAPLPAHEVVVSRLNMALLPYIGLTGRGMVLTGGALQSASGTHLEPDLLVVPRVARIPTQWLDMPPPWLAIEVSCRHSRIYDRDFKGPAYTALGVPEYWRVDLRDRCVYVSIPSGPEERAEAEQLVWTAPGAHEPLVIHVPTLFDGVDDQAD